MHVYRRAANSTIFILPGYVYGQYAAKSCRSSTNFLSFKNAAHRLIYFAPGYAHAIPFFIKATNYDLFFVWVKVWISLGCGFISWHVDYKIIK